MSDRNKIEHVIDVTQATVESKADAIVVNGQLFLFKNTGLTRRVFVNKELGIVVKVPITEHDRRYNEREADLWESMGDEKRKTFAETKLLPNGYVIQEFLHTMDDDETPEWLGRSLTMEEIFFSRACRDEVGFDKDGNMKCYDFDEYMKY
jgi:hypothetical protein